MRGLNNVTLAEFRDYLRQNGLSLVRTKGGHEAWMKQGMTRPIVIQTHKDPIPEFVIQNNLRTLGISRKDFVAWLEQQ